MSSRNNDPTEWANRKKAQMERAKQIREDRKNALNEGDTFTPHVNPRPQPAAKPADSLDRLANQVSRTNDPMEMPLPGNKSKGYLPPDDHPPSPNSDALGREMKRYGGPSASQAAKDAQYKSQFLQQYEDQKRRQREDAATQGRNAAPTAMAPPAEEDSFANLLRNDDNSRGAGPGWNNDTTTSGFDAAPRRPLGGRTKSDTKPSGSRPSAFRAAPVASLERGHSDHFDTRNHGPTSSSSAMHDRRLSPRGTSFGGYGGVENTSNGAKPSPRLHELEIAKPRLSLLKSKIRQSESAGSRSFSGKPTLPPEDPLESPGRRTAPTASQRAVGTEGYQFNPARERRGGGGGVGMDEMDRETGAPPLPRGVAVPPNRVIKRAPPRASPREALGGLPMDQDGDEASSLPPGGKATRPPPRPHQTANRPPPSLDDAPVPALVRQQQVYAPSPYPEESSSSSSSYPWDGQRQGEEDAAYPHDEQDDGGEQLECPDCGRKFNRIPFSKHVKICQKVFQKKRKVFDSSKMRIQDNPELVKLVTAAKKQEKKASASASVMARGARQDENYFSNMDNNGPSAPARGGGGEGKARPAGGRDAPVGPAEAQPKWKAQSNALRDAMKAMREYQKAKEAGAPLPPPVVTGPDPSLIPCPHCGRRFNEQAGSRHIPQCQSIKAKPTSLKKGSGTGIGSLTAAKAPAGRKGR